MATSILLAREGNRLSPIDPTSFELIESMKGGEIVAAEITRPRNLGHHRKFFALVNVVFEAQERYPTRDHLLDAIKIGIGHYDLVPINKKQTVIKTRSISFARMDQENFEKFYNKAVDHILKAILPGVGRQDLEQQVIEFMGE